MHPGKLPLLLILLATVGIVAVAFFGRDKGRWSSLTILLTAALLAALSLASAYLGVVALARGSLTLAKHGAPLTISATGSPFLYPILVGFFFLLAFALGYGALRVSRLGAGP